MAHLRAVLWLVGFLLAVSPAGAQDAVPSSAHSPSPYAPVLLETRPGGQVEAAASPSASDAEPAIADTHLLCPPPDPCLPAQYRDWQELGDVSRKERMKKGIQGARIVIDRRNFLLTLEAVGRDGETEEVYRTHVGLGDFDTPTPEGRFLINHIYCYPDVVFFGPDAQPIPELYKGFLAPILLCDGSGRCDRFRDLGMHGFEPAALPGHRRDVQVVAVGAISNGCIRIPDACRFKEELVRLVGVGPIKKNDRGCYHWLKNPVEVTIEGSYPETGESATLMSLMEQGVGQVQEGLKSFFSWFGP